MAVGRVNRHAPPSPPADLASGDGFIDAFGGVWSFRTKSRNRGGFEQSARHIHLTSDATRSVFAFTLVEVALVPVAKAFVVQQAANYSCLPDPMSSRVERVIR